MKTTIKSAAALFAAAFVSSGVAAFGQYNYYGDTPPPSMQDWPNNDFTNKIVVPTVECYTNNQAAIAADQQSRAQQQGGCPKGAVVIHAGGARIETRPPTAYVNSDPWIQPDHPWDIYTNSPVISPIPAAGSPNAPVMQPPSSNTAH